MNDPVLEIIYLSPKRLLFGKIAFLTVISLVFYIELLVNLYLLEQQIPIYLNYIIVLVLVVLIVLEIILSHIRASKSRIEIYNSRLEWKGKKHRIAFYDEVHSLNLEKDGLDNIFRTGSLVINNRWRIRGVPNPNEVFFKLQKFIPRYD